eukprot:scaffold129396_cov36-Tisochrysis_lutea.AAC.2
MPVHLIRRANVYVTQQLRHHHSHVQRCAGGAQRHAARHRRKAFAAPLPMACGCDTSQTPRARCEATRA